MRIRAAALLDAAGIARVQVSSWQTTYRGIVSDDFLQQMDVVEFTGRWEQRLNGENQHISIYVAETEAGEIVGFISGGPERSRETEFDGELYAIYTLQERQQRGLGTRLVQALAERMVQQGFRSMICWALTENGPARTFYEKLGGRTISEKKIDIGGRLLDEVSYGWDDLRKLVSG